MAKALDLRGARYGQLTVVDSRGTVNYGGRRQLQWLCRCDCGTALELPAAKLPYSPANERAAQKAGRLIYTSCEQCRRKTCAICGDRFSHSHPSYICPKPSCQDELQRERDAFWHRAALQRYRDDPEFRAKWNEFQRDYFARHGEQMREKQRARIEALPPEKRAQYQEKRARRSAENYNKLKADPEKYARHLALGRERINKHAAREFLATAEQLLKRNENTGDNTKNNPNDQTN